MTRRQSSDSVIGASAKPRTQALFSSKRLAKLRADAVADLDAASPEKASRARLKRAMARLAEMSDDLTRDGLMRRYVYAVAALVQHERAGGLKPHQVAGVVDVAFSVLQLLGLKRGHNRSSALYSDVETIAGQIARGEGRHWDAAWHGMLARISSPGAPSGGPAFASMATGLRALRLGCGELAVAALGDAVREAKGPTRDRAVVEYARALRLTRRFDETLAHVETHAADAALRPESRTELAWEKACVEASRVGELERLVDFLAQDDASHPSYAIEASLWLAAAPRASEAAAARAARAWRGFKPTRATDGVVRFLRELSGLKELKLPMTEKIMRLGRHLEAAARLPSIDKELLVVAACARLAGKLRAHDAAALAAARYRAASMALTDGRSGDVLGLDLA